MPKKKKSFFEKVEAEVVEGAENYVKNKIKKKVLKYTEISVLALLAFVLISIGLAQLLEAYFPILANGWNYIVLGIVFILMALLIKM